MRTIAYAPVGSLTPEGITLDFVPIDAPTWDANQEGAGRLHVYADGTVRHSCQTLTREDLDEARQFLILGYA